MNRIVPAIVPARVGSNCVNKIVASEQNRSKYEQSSPREKDSTCTAATERQKTVSLESTSQSSPTSTVSSCKFLLADAESMKTDSCWRQSSPILQIRLSQTVCFVHPVPDSSGNIRFLELV